jgi:TRAP-type C4-dicarboxylate transport system permease small subunit
MPEDKKRNLFDRIAVGAFSIVLVVNSLTVTLIITGAALARYIFKVNFNGYDELTVLVAFWLYFMGAAYGAYNNSHVSADVIDAYFPEGRTKKTITCVRWLITSAVCLLFVTYGFEYVKFSFVGPLGNFKRIPRSMVWRIPFWISQSSIFIGLIFMEIYFVRNFVLSAKALLSGRREA